MPTWIVFSERLSGNPAAGGRVPGRIDRDYGILVDETLDDVAKALAAGEMPRFTRRWANEPVSVSVNPSAVLYIEEYGAAD
jgi:hypothetical protein